MQTLQRAVQLAEQQGMVDKRTVWAQARIGEILYALDRPEDALRHFQQSLEQYESVRNSGRGERLLWLRAELHAQFYWDIAAICMDLKRFDLADQYLDQSLQQCRKNHSRAPQGTNMRWFLATVHGFLGKSKMLQGKVDESLEYYDQYQTRLEELLKDDPSAWQAVYDLCHVHEELGEFHWQRGEQEAAREHYRESAARAKSLLPIYEGRALFLDSSWIIEWLIVSPIGKRPLGLLTGTIRTESEGDKILQFLAVNQAKLAATALDAGNPAQAEEHARESFHYTKKLTTAFAAFPTVLASMRQRFTEISYVRQRLEQNRKTEPWLQKIRDEIQ